MSEGAGVPWAQRSGSDEGRRVFASHCIVCHSSKQPKIFDETPDTQRAELLSNPEYQAWAQNAVEATEVLAGELPVDRSPAAGVADQDQCEAARWLEQHRGERLGGVQLDDLQSAAARASRCHIWNPFTRKTEAMTLPQRGTWILPAGEPRFGLGDGAVSAQQQRRPASTTTRRSRGVFSPSTMRFSKLLVGGATTRTRLRPDGDSAPSLNGATLASPRTGSRRDLAAAAVRLAPDSGRSLAVLRRVAHWLAGRRVRTVVDRPARPPGAGDAVHHRARLAARRAGYVLTFRRVRHCRSRVFRRRQADGPVRRSVPSRAPGRRRGECRSAETEGPGLARDGSRLIQALCR